MNFKERESVDKLRGGYYTPLPIAQFLARWVLAAGPATVLEPGCGDGVFAEALQSLHHPIQFTGVELVKEEVSKARKRAKNSPVFKARILNENFLAWAIRKIESGERYDAVVGNPPYVRYQYLDENHQKLAGDIFRKYGMVFTKHTNAWVPFVVASIGLLSPRGRLAMVIPSEVLHILYAASLREFLSVECHRVLILDPNELLFEGALQGTVLLMAQKKSTEAEASEGVAVTSITANEFLVRDPEQYFERASYASGDILDGKWTKLLLSSAEFAVLEEARRHPLIRRFGDLASADAGIQTAADKFFVVDRATVRKFDLSGFVRPVLGRIEHCPGVIYDKALREKNEERGLPSYLVNFGKTALGDLPQRAREYISLGEAQGLPGRYKCSVRNPWYSLPSVCAAKIVLAKRSYEFHRLILNSADVCTTTTAYRIRAVSDEVTPARLVFYFVNSLTALSAELEGRHYGGGVLELVPSEIDELLVPAPRLLDIDLKGLNTKMTSRISAKELLRAQDAIVLKSAGLATGEREVIHGAWDRLRARRHRRVGQVLDEDQGKLGALCS